MRRLHRDHKVLRAVDTHQNRNVRLDVRRHPEEALLEIILTANDLAHRRRGMTEPIQWQWMIGGDSRARLLHKYRVIQGKNISHLLKRMAEVGTNRLRHLDAHHRLYIPVGSRFTMITDLRNVHQEI